MALKNNKRDQAMFRADKNEKFGAINPNDEQELKKIWDDFD